MYLGKEAGQEILPMFTGGGCSERVTGQDPSGHTMDITLKCNKACCSLILWTTFPPKLRLTPPGACRGFIRHACFVKVLKLKNHHLEVYNLLEDLMKTLHLALSSSGLPGCPGQRVDEVVAANSYPRQALGRASGGESKAEQRRLEGGLGHASFRGGQFRNI